MRTKDLVPTAATASPWLRRAGVTLLAVAGLAAVQTALMIVAIGNENDAPIDLSAPRVFGWHLGSLLPWALIAPAILALGERLSPERPLRAVLVHLPAAAVAAIVLGSAAVASNHALRPFGRANGEGEGELASALVIAIGATAPLSIALYFAILGGGLAAGYYHRFREREVRAAQLETRLATARLEALRLQIQPHFLFNTLHTVGGLVRQGEPDAAVDTLSRLSDLLRVTLDGEGRQLVPLADELRVAELYLEIQRTRFSDRLRVERAVDAELLPLPVPSFVLQPLLENAVRHGIAARAGAGTLGLVAARDGDGRLRLEVHDDGKGIAPAGEGALAAERRDGTGGKGLANVRSRLEQLYGDGASLELLPRPGGGAIARLRLPAAPATAGGAA